MPRVLFFAFDSLGGRRGMTIHQFKFLVPLFPAGQEPLPQGISEEERPQYEQNKKIEKYMGMAAESCAFKSATAGVFGS
jgi:hypothetical protein